MSAQRTPAADWREQGGLDPHDTRYDCERHELAMGDLSDDAMANEVYLWGNHRPSIPELIAGTAKPGIVYLEAAKDRIRWLSRRLVAAEKLAASPPLSRGEVDARLRAAGMYGLLSEILGKGALSHHGDDDLIERVRRACADQEAVMALDRKTARSAS